MSNPFKIRGSKDACTRRDERNLAKGDLCRTNGLQTDHERYTIVNRRRHKVDHLVGNTFKASDSLFESGWFVIDSNLSHTFYIVDQKSQLIRQAIRIRLFSDMSEREVAELQAIASHWRHDSFCHSKITNNAAARKGHGSMYAAGWQTGYENYEDLSGNIHAAAYGSYAKGQKTTQDKWLQLRSSDHLIHSFYGKRFRSLLPQQFYTQQAAARRVGLPMLGSSTGSNLNADDADLFGPTATYTFQGFYNSLHVDNDSEDHMAFGIFLPVQCDKSFTLMPINKGYQQVSGGFINAHYKTIVDFASIDGSVEMAWWGATDAHCTLEPEWFSPQVSCNQTHLGSSVQISQKLEHRIDHLNLSGSARLVIDDVVRQQLKDERRI